MQGISAVKNPDYIEGRKALENFEGGMKALFQVPKESAPSREKPAKKRAKKTSGRGVFRDSGGVA